MRLGTRRFLDKVAGHTYDPRAFEKVEVEGKVEKSALHVASAQP